MSEASNEFLFDFIREVQLESTSALSYHFYELASRNPLTAQDDIVSNLGAAHDNGQDVLDNVIKPFFDAELYYFRALATQSVSGISICLGYVYSEYQTKIADIRGNLAVCTA